MDRRRFLQILGSAGVGTVAAAVMPPGVWWTPAARTILVPDRMITTARTMQEALTRGLVAVFPDGQRLELVIGKPLGDHSLAVAVAAEVRAIEAMGGRVVARRQWR